MGKLDRPESNFVTRFVIFRSKKGIDGDEKLTFDDNRRCNKYYSSLNKLIKKRKQKFLERQKNCWFQSYKCKQKTL